MALGQELEAMGSIANGKLRPGTRSPVTRDEAIAAAQALACRIARLQARQRKVLQIRRIYLRPETALLRHHDSESETEWHRLQLEAIRAG
jgi:hypothetical protein